MAKFKVIEYRDSLGNRRGWTVVTLPSDYREGEEDEVGSAMIELS
jgi:hypothetical protein